MELRLNGQMQTSGGLLVAGGWLDQPARLLATIRHCAEVYAAMKAIAVLPLGKKIEWLQAHPREAAIYDWVCSERDQHGA